MNKDNKPVGEDEESVSVDDEQLQEYDLKVKDECQGQAGIPSKLFQYVENKTPQDGRMRHQIFIGNLDSNGTNIKSEMRAT